MENEQPAKASLVLTGGNNNPGTAPVYDQDPENTSDDRQAIQIHQQELGGRGETTMNMGGLASALPTYGHRGGQQSYHSSIPSGQNAAMFYQYPTGQFSSTPIGQTPPFAQQIPVQYQDQRMYGYQTSPTMTQPQFGNTMYMGNLSLMPGSMAPPFQSFHHGPVFNQVPENHFARSGHYHQMHGHGMNPAGQFYPSRDTSDIQQTIPPSSITKSAALRGPPRKPKQSGHALWVGNLPPGASIVDLKDHFARDATDEIESVFLISKSNCAFVNYKTEESCAAAMARFHDSRFQGVRVVCRLRRGTASGPTAISTNDPPEVASAQVSSDLDAQAAEPDHAEEATETEQEVVSEIEGTKAKERFFIIKSLTMEDLERSVQTGIWATQSHNEVALNKAYKTAENVYLIFSANKSGEYFGYARMQSAIDDEAAALIASETPVEEQKPAVDTAASMPAVLPMTIPTAATATAPRGHIIDDSARGTIFWEAVSGDSAVIESKTSTPTETEDLADLGQSAQSPSSLSANLEVLSTQTTFGKPFKISWQSTDRLPFYRTRGLRNPWNTNREVKIARDGTEIEPTIGRKLVDMFGTQPTAQVRAQPPYSGPMIVGSGFGPGNQTYGSGY